MGDLAVGWERSASDPGVGLGVPCAGVVAGWGIGIRVCPPTAREYRDRVSSECSYREDGAMENLRGGLGGGSGDRQQFLSFGGRRRVCLSLHADAVAGVCGEGDEIVRWTRAGVRASCLSESF